ncbi:Multidrug resistance-associated protein 1 [Mortierella alpina]|nr:Multidrug resistance-associated protein 1 [Mortierella alpina]
MVVLFIKRGYSLYCRDGKWRRRLPLDRWLYWISLACMLTACAALITRLVLLDEARSPASTLASAALLVAWLVATGLNYLENQHSTRSSTYIYGFYVICLIASAISIRTMHDIHHTSQPQFASFCVYFGAICCGFIAEAWPRRLLIETHTKSHPQDESLEGEDVSKPTAFDRANLFSRISFHFLQKVVSLGYRRPLQDSDIANMMPRHTRTLRSYEFVSAVWERHVQKRKLANKAPSLLWVVFKAGGWATWSSIVFFALTESAMDYVQPVMLDVILNYIASFSTDTPQATSLGVTLSIGLFVTSLLASLATGQYYLRGTNLGIELKSGLTSMIYRKSLKLSPGARREATVGEITNHMSVDAERICHAVTLIPRAISAPVEVALGIWLLYRQLGPSAFTGLGVVILAMPVQGFIGNVLNKAKDKKLEAMDGRVRLLTEVLSGIKIVKLYSWERSFQKKLETIREKELKHLMHIGTTMAFMLIMYTSLPSLMSLLSFVVYALFGGPGGTRGAMSAQVVFVSITLFNRLAKPIGTASSIVNQIISLNVAVKRVQGFLLQEEIDDSHLEYQETSLDDLPKSASETTLLGRGENGAGPERAQRPALRIQDGTFSWNNQETTRTSPDASLEKRTVSTTTTEEKETPSTNPTPVRAALTDINFEVPQGSLTVIMGRVGQGKSSLVSAIIGDMYTIQGRVQIHGRMAYVPQQAWIFNATVRDNIIFGKEFNQELYDKIVMASGLEPDLKMLPAGDNTEIGEKGINLSGGQKQRVSLARAAYQDADIYLLDDPLSAVDAHVDQHLWQNLIGPKGLLKDKTRLLITHGIHHLSEVDQIAVIKDGAIAETGTYEALMAAQGSFCQLIREYAMSEQKAREGVIVEAESSASGVKAELPEESLKTAVVADKGADPTMPAAELAEDDDGELIMEEKAAEGSVGFAVFMGYAKATTYLFAALGPLGFALSQASQIGISVWLQNWASTENSGDQPSVGTLLGVYAALVALYIVCDTGVNLVILVSAGIRAARILHRNLLQTVMRLPMRYAYDPDEHSLSIQQGYCKEQSTNLHFCDFIHTLLSQYSFFDTTPVGRIVNRFSSDMDNVDELVPFNISDFYFFLSSVIGTLVVISFSVPIFMALIPFLVVIYLVLQIYYIRSSRALKRLHSISKSPLYQHFGETLTGVSTIRAMRVHHQFILDNAIKSDRSSNAFFVFTIAARWLSVRLELLGSIIVLATSLLAVLGRETLGPSMAGLALSYALNVTFSITYLVTSFTDLQNQLVSVERIQEYTAKKQEAPLDMPKDEQLPESWPSSGKIVFKQYSTRYRQGMDLVIKKISFEVQPSEKVGIVGRTGAGKSSLTLALFRIIEAANSHWAKASDNAAADSDADLKTIASLHGDANTAGEASALETVSVEEDGGSIEIDGVDISTVGLERLRQHLAIIPQDPTLFAGTVRDNLDPFDQATDVEVWEALERAHLKTYISSMPGGLSYEVSQNGDNFSVGQRSLICLARALLRKTKILILDEATAAVDVETDELIQKTIRLEFKDRTILTIAHRIKTVMDSDKILVLERGQVEEYDSPQVLLQKQGLFYSLAQQAGEAN